MVVGAIIAGVGLAVNLIGGILGSKAKKRAARERRAIDLENVRMGELEVKEQVSRARTVAAGVEGRQQTAIGASGFAAGSSLDRYAATTAARHKSDIDWMRTAGARRAALGTREANARYSAAKKSANIGLISTLGSAISSGAGMFSGKSVGALGKTGGSSGNTWTGDTSSFGFG